MLNLLADQQSIMRTAKFGRFDLRCIDDDCNVLFDHSTETWQIEGPRSADRLQAPLGLEEHRRQRGRRAELRGGVHRGEVHHRLRRGAV